MNFDRFGVEVAQGRIDCLRMSHAYIGLLTYALDEQVNPSDEELQNAYRELHLPNLQANRRFVEIQTRDL
jgi:hypothetical protein